MITSDSIIWSRASIELGSVDMFQTGGQSYKAPTIVMYISWVINISDLLVRTTLES